MALYLDIRIIPYSESVDIVVNGRIYTLSQATVSNEDDVRHVLRDQPQYIFETIKAMIAEAR